MSAIRTLDALVEKYVELRVEAALLQREIDALREENERILADLHVALA